MANIKETNIKVYETEDYGMFHFAEWNRDINKRKVYELLESLKEFGYVGSPIIVNESYVVIDGQHRLEACKKGNIPVQYIIRFGVGVNECRRLNVSQQNWTTATFVESFANEYTKDETNSYVRLQKLIEQFGESIRTINYAINGCWNEKSIRTGNFKMSDAEYEQAIDTLTFINKTKECRKYFNRDYWLHALISLHSYGLIEEERMINQLNKYGNTLTGTTNLKDAISALCELYNYNQRQKIRFVDKWLDARGER